MVSMMLLMNKFNFLSICYKISLDAPSFTFFSTANILCWFYTSRHLSSYVASSEQFLVVLVVQVITLELSILSVDLPMEGMLQSQVVATST